MAFNGLGSKQDTIFPPPPNDLNRGMKLGHRTDNTGRWPLKSRFRPSKVPNSPIYVLFWPLLDCSAWSTVLFSGLQLKLE
jgi:hypothetical protein